MRRYVWAYAAWLTAVLTAGAAALWWYKHVEEIGAQELAKRFAGNGQPDDAGDVAEVVADATAP